MLRTKFILILLSVCGLLASGCSDEPGRIRATAKQVLGVYIARFDSGVEHLELRADGVYVQDFQSPKRPFVHSGKWIVKDNFLGRTDVILLDAVVSEDNQDSRTTKTGERVLNVHMRGNKIALAINEVADWYFEKVS